MKKKSFVILTLTGILIIFTIFYSMDFFQKDKDDNKTTNYMETPHIQSCTNDENLELNLRFLTYENDLGSYFVTSSNQDIAPKIKSVSEVTKSDGSKLFTFSLAIKVPSGVSKFDLNFQINGNNYSVKNIENMNFNVPIETRSKEFVVYSPYVSDGEMQEFNNQITFNGVDFTDANFTIFGETILEKNILNKNKVEIISENNKPAIVGYYYEKDNQKVCIANSYHTEYLDKDEK